jgi:hypothetical protein
MRDGIKRGKSGSLRTVEVRSLRQVKDLDAPPGLSEIRALAGFEIRDAIGTRTPSLDPNVCLVYGG